MVMQEDDEAWFRDNPRRLYRLRWATEEEIAAFTQGDQEMREAFKFYQVVCRDGRSSIHGTTALKSYARIEGSDDLIAEYLAEHSLALE
jgi:hypothetical protein